MSKLFAKLAQIQSELKSIPESGRNQHFGYNYATAEDIINAVRPVCSQHGVFITISCSDHQILKDGKAASVIVTLTAIDSETGESTSSSMPGYAEDSRSDKSLWKCITGATKYCIRAFFCLATTDDPELEDSPESAPTKSTPANATANGKTHKTTVNTLQSSESTSTNGKHPPAPRPQPPRSSEPPATPDVNTLRQGQTVPALPHNDNEQASMITATTHEMVRLNWSTAQGRLFLQEHFGKSTRKELSLHELYQFLEHLRSLPTPLRSPVPVPS